MKQDELTKALPENHLMPTVKYGCVEYIEWCRAEARRINQDPSRNVILQRMDRSHCRLVEIVEEDTIEI